MEVVITGRRLAVTPALRLYVEDRARKLERYASKATKVSFILRVEKYRHLAEVSAHVNGFLLQAREETEEMYSSVDRAMEKIFKQLKRYKGKVTNHRDKTLNEEGWDRERILSPQIPHRHLRVEEMTVEEAVKKLSGVADDFLFFSDPLSRQFNVLLRTKDGKFEVLEPVG